MKKLLSMLAILVFAVSAAAQSQLVVVPADRATQPGNRFFGAVFGAQGTVDQVYGSKNFSGPVQINAIAFRMDEASPSGSMEAIIPRAVVHVSTYFGTFASYRPGGYDQNKGADDTTTFDAALHWISSDVGIAPNPFDLRIQFSTPFYYDPSKGALLVNLTTSGQFGSSIIADFHGHGDPSIGWSEGGVVPGNLVTEFNVTPVPEPRFTWLVVAGACAMLLARKRRHEHN